MKTFTIRERCAILHRRLVSQGISEKHARLMMDDLIPILRTADVLSDADHIKLMGFRQLTESYNAAWRRITG